MLAKVAEKPQILAILLLLGLTAMPEVAHAQRPQRYQPARPTVSPYLNLLRANPSSVPNYYSFVRPQQRQIAINRQQQEVLLRQNTAIRRLQNGPLQVDTSGPVSGTRSWFQQPGSRYSFQNGTGIAGR